MTTLLQTSLTAALMSRSRDSSSSSTSIAPPTACLTTATFSARLGITSLKPGSTLVFNFIAISSDRGGHPHAWSRRLRKCPCKRNTLCGASKTSPTPGGRGWRSGRGGLRALGRSEGRIRPHDHEHRRIVIWRLDEEGIECGLDSSHGLPWIGDLRQAGAQTRFAEAIIWAAGLGDPVGVEDELVSLGQGRGDDPPLGFGRSAKQRSWLADRFHGPR